MKHNKHLYKGTRSHRGAEERSFERRYGSGPGRLRSGRYVPNKGAAIYHATVGKVKRQRGF
jgi:hypothetical protein